MFGRRTICIFIIAIIASVIDTSAIRIIVWSKAHHREVLTGEYNYTGGRDITLGFSSIAGEDYNQLIIADAVTQDVIISYSFSKQSPIGYLQIGEFVFVENIITKEAFYLQDMESIHTELNTYRDENVYLTAKQQQLNMTKDYVLSEIHTRYDMTMLQHLSEAIAVEARTNEWNSTSTVAISLASDALYPYHTNNRTVRNGVCPNNKSKHCVKKPIGTTCLGLCGPGVHCWWWLCGDCCYHEGCYKHDICCRKYGSISWQCLSIWNFSCEHYDCS
ncbi:hypothetical protein LOD99_4317 [Oopsacas minuta]|uniref:Uncharacterized protein n=1 Tax=Oopsacas minuta TaxID=111878 RepID=A0AAV7JUE9_9METZ|nr:hypothetical protein LOD99_4317 [Oopsacas minuta]